MSESLAHEYISPEDASKILGVSSATVRRMIRAKKLDSFVMPPGNRYRITPEQFMSYVNKNNIPLTEEARALLEAKQDRSKTQ
jgi:excisionase family DNA binding protein